MTATACSPGSALLQPRRIRLATVATADDALVQDFVAVATRIAADASSGAAMAGVLEEAILAAGSRLLERAGGGMTRAIQHLQDLIQPLLSVVQELEAVDPSDPAAVEQAIMDVLTRAADALGGLSLDRLRAGAGKVLDVLQQDFGLSPTGVEEELWALIDDVVARLEALPAGDDPEARVNRLNVAGLLRRIERRMKDGFSFPEINADLLATALFDDLRRLGLAESLSRLACVGRAARSGLTVAQDVLELVPFTGFGSHSLGAGEGSGGNGSGGGAGGGSGGGAGSPPEVEYLWYPSWLLANTNRNHWYNLFTFGADFWIDRRGGVNRVMRDSQKLFDGDTFNWSAVPVGSDDVLAGKETSDLRPLNYTFRKKPADDLEAWARHTAWIADAAEGLLHIWHPTYGLAIKKGGDLSAMDFMHVLWDGGNATWEAIARMPWRFWMLKAKEWDQHWYSKVATYLPTVAADLGGSFQMMHTNGTVFVSWMINAIFDGLNILGDMAIPALFRNLLLSYFTIRNYDGPQDPPDSGADTRPDNRLAIDGIAAIPMFFADWFFFKVIFPRGYYGHPFTGDSATVTDWSVKTWLLYCLLLYGVVTAFFSGSLAWATAAVVGLAVGAPAKDAQNYGYSMLKAALRIGATQNGSLTASIFDAIRVFPMSFWLFLYAIKENDTGGGTWNPFGSDFKGYPDNAASPYRLPWAKDRNYLCVQGNLGLWSHNFTNPGGEQVYAYDFTLDSGDEILVARDGTVVDWFDSVLNGSHSSTNTPSAVPTAAGQTGADTWNFVMIRHDTSDPAHDLGPPSTPGSWPTVTTYAIYGHGQQGSVRSTFAARTTSVAPGAIIGTRVKQGEPIMLADNTGVSFLDHVHIEVRPGPAPPPAGTPTTPVNRTGASIGQSLPFVFADVPAIGAIGISSGNPQSKHWYASGNPRVTPP